MTLRAPDPSVRRALAFTPMETRRDVLVDSAVLAERLGYEAVMIPEAWGLDATVVLAEIAMRTERIRLVAGVLSPWGRSAAAIAMAAASLDDLSDGRFTLGLGVSTPVLAERLHGVPFHRPAARLRATVDDVRRLLAGERRTDTEAGRGLRLGSAPRPQVPIWVAGNGPMATALAVDHADAWCPAMTPLDGIGAIRSRAASLGTGDPELVCFTLAAVDTPTTEARTTASHLAAWYLTGMGPFYGDALAQRGHAGEVDAIRAANPRPNPFAMTWPPEADGLLPQLAVFGDHEDVATALRPWDASADLVALCVAPEAPSSIFAAIEAGAPQATTALSKRALVTGGA